MSRKGVTRRGCLITLAILIGIVTLGVALAFYLTRDAVLAADEFLEHLGQGRTPEAYLCVASHVRAKASEEAFAGEMSQIGLDQYASSSWSSRTVQGDRASVEGTVKTKAGWTIPLRIELVKENDRWKVHTVVLLRGG